MMFLEVIILSFLALEFLGQAEDLPPVALPDPSECIGDLESWVACDSFVAKSIECLAKPTQEEKDTCPCNEDFWNTITA